jgi:hypothetical protein
LTVEIIGFTGRLAETGRDRSPMGWMGLNWNARDHEPPHWFPATDWVHEPRKKSSTAGTSALEAGPSN